MSTDRTVRQLGAAGIFFVGSCLGVNIERKSEEIRKKEAAAQVSSEQQNAKQHVRAEIAQTVKSIQAALKEECADERNFSDPDRTSICEQLQETADTFDNHDAPQSIPSLVRSTADSRLKREVCEKPGLDKKACENIVFAASERESKTSMATKK